MRVALKRWIARVAVATLLVGVGTAAQAQTYYVAQNHPPALANAYPGSQCG